MSAGAIGAPLTATVVAGPVATAPAEVRGRGRDDVRLMVAERSTGLLRHLAFADIVEVLTPGDLVVVNTSATLPAAVPVYRSGPINPARPGAAAPEGALLLHLSTRLPGGSWLVELRSPSGVGSLASDAGRAGEVLSMPGGARVRLVSAYRAASAHSHRPSRLWLAELHLPTDVLTYLARHGQPIRYGHARRPWPISHYQTVFATEAGSAEMPSAGRAFTAELVTALVAHGVGVAPVVLHAGVSSPEEGEVPPPEYYRVPAATARWVNATRDGGGRAVAVGTTVVRALESASDDRGRVRPAQGWTELLIGPARGVKAVDALLTGWHEPDASHLAMVEAVAGRSLLDRTYREAAEHGYLWHEFGDLCLLLP